MHNINKEVKLIVGHELLEIKNDYPNLELISITASKFNVVSILWTNKYHSNLHLSCIITSTNNGHTVTYILLDDKKPDDVSSDEPYVWYIRDIKKEGDLIVE